MSKIKINNYSRTSAKYVIYRVVDGENWYYGEADKLENAMRIVSELTSYGNDARIIESENVE